MRAQPSLFLRTCPPPPRHRATGQDTPKQVPIELEQHHFGSKPPAPALWDVRQEGSPDRWAGLGWWEVWRGAQLHAKDQNLGPTNSVNQSQRKIDPDMAKLGLLSGGDGGGPGMSHSLCNMSFAVP